MPDYHETEEAFLLVYDLGRISLEWNMVEHFFSGAIWELLGDYPAGIAITAGMGNTSKSDVVLRLSRERIKDAAVLDAVDFACKAFNVLRDNRNVLVHSHSIFPGDGGGKPHWRRAHGRHPSGHKSTEADLKDLELTIAQICALGLFVVDLVPFLHARRRRKWDKSNPPAVPQKFPMPVLLKQAPECSDGAAQKKPRPNPKKDSLKGAARTRSRAASTRTTRRTRQPT